MITPTLVQNVKNGYERLNWSFTPLAGKKPIQSDWQKRPRETIDDALGWAAKGNVGLRTGAASGIFVIDVDPGGDVAPLNLPPTVTVRTGRCGKHYYFAYTGPLGNSQSKLGPHIDTRGNGGQVVYPGSIHPDTKEPYGWEKGFEPWALKLADLPQHIIELLTPPPITKPAQKTPTPAQATIAGTDSAYALAALRGECEAVQGAPEGTRNARLNTAALKLGQLVGAGLLDRATVETELQRAAESAGLGLQEIKATIRSGLEAGIRKPRHVEPGRGRAAAEGDTGATADGTRGPCEFRCTDSGNAEVIAALYGDRLRFDHRRGRWLLWSGHSWHPDADGEIDRLALAAARARYSAAANLEGDEKKRQSNWAVTSESQHRRAAALALARSERPIADAGDGWDSDPWLVGVMNGVIDLRTGQLRDGRPGDRITLALPWNYDPDAKAPRWERFIAEIFAGNDDLPDFVHCAVGYSFTGQTTEQCLFICWGIGANGKTVFLQTLRIVFGPLACNTGFSTFELTNRQTASNDVAALVDRRLVTASETNDGTRLNEARIKMLTGGDVVTARFLYAEPFEFQPVAKLWLTVNHRPRVSDDSEGFWRRVRLIPFVRQFTGSAADHDLADTLRAEAPGILSWIVRGCMEWQRRGLKPPTCVTSAVADYRAESDPLSDFLDECCIIALGRSATAADLYRAYGVWATRQGLTERERVTQIGFGRRLGDRFKRGKVNGARCYHGVGLTGTC